jgi:beta-glucosidase
VVVFGEDPYAEFQGDRVNLDFDDDRGLKILAHMKQAGIPTVAIFLSGRPLWVNPELNKSDAFVAAFLPGSEGGAIADVLFSDRSGKPAFPFSGQLSFSWPNNATGSALNIGDNNYEPLFRFGYGLTYADDKATAAAMSMSPRQ